MVRAYIRVPEREGEGMETMIAETDRMQFCERDKVGKIIGQLNRAEMADIDRGLRL